MTAQVVRRIQLPADRTSPAAARDAVRAAVAEAGLSALLDEALLLTTELSTNAVVHARTGIELEILAGPDSITVTVLDFRTGLFTDPRWMLARSKQDGRANTPGDAGGSAGVSAGGSAGGSQQPGAGGRAGARAEDLEERGRGLLLVDQLASCWGTLHHPGGKGVWFRLDTDSGAMPAPARTPIAAALIARAGTPEQAGTTQAGTLEQAGTTQAGTLEQAGTTQAGTLEQAPSAAALASLTADGAPDQGTLTEVADDLLQRLCTVVGAAGAELIVDEGTGQGAQSVAAYGEPVPVTDGALRVALDLSGGCSGQLALWPASSGYAGALTALTAERLSLVVENRRLRRSDSQRRTGLMFLAEASELLAQSLDVELTLALVPRLVVPRLGVWCAVHTADDTGELKLAAATHADESQLPELLSSLDAALPELRAALKAEAMVPLTQTVDGYAVALLARGQQLGTLAVGRGAEPWHGAEDLAMVEDVARRSALAIDNARIHAERRAVAEALQRSLLPPALPHIDGVDFGAEYVPTGVGAEVGGDFYDVVELPDEHWLVVVGDVSGKGVQAATVTGLVRDVTRVLVRDGRPLTEVLTRLNETLVDRGGGRFCTLALAEVEPAGDGVLNVTLYLAGHDQPVLLRRDGSTAMVGRYGTAIGLLGTVSCAPTRLALAAGDALIFYTDGVTERRRGVDLFGVDRVREQAAGLAGFTADVIAARMRTATLGFSPEPPRDDIAIFVLRNDAPA